MGFVLFVLAGMPAGGAVMASVIIAASGWIIGRLMKCESHEDDEYDPY